MASISTTTLTMTRRFEVAPEKVFEAWLKPNLMRKWLFTMEHTNKIAQSDGKVGGNWEIVDHREGKDYRATGEYLEIIPPTKMVLTFEMPQFSETVDKMMVVIEPLEDGCEMTFTQEIVIPHEEGWTEKEVKKVEKEYYEGSEHGWNLMFLGLKQLVETGNINYPS
ncbi:SRPBCC family protein [Niallia endozanthoxylica]|uniref:SRPBCC domain-containing protein n=1 Tax=Niallia endozanthoxylica TaxID=2036016 RepID=A0A5J5HUM0_9BACI|nr:SRPBCC domain-containing protein [Niallia endozanthoxylica]KAA9023995.1 SRPBCC domain-containing protein [Niallia endozanthoxylica]